MSVLQLGKARIAFIGVVAVVAAYYVFSDPLDVRVYHNGVRGVFDGTRPVYGPASGLGWPMHYRYPPLFLFVFAPLAVFPVGITAALWVVMKVAVLVLMIRLLVADVPRTWSYASGLVALLLAGPYIVQDFRYGNAQFFIIALTVAALLYSRRTPYRAAFFLALATSLKVWPLYFFPYFVIQKRWKLLGCAAALTLVLTMLPALYFGIGGQWDLLQQWFAQEFSTQLGESEIWFPSQSLRGVLMRYFTVIDYSTVPDSNYPLVHLVSLPATTIRFVWLLIAAAGYAGIMAIAARRNRPNEVAVHGLLFCGVALLMPFIQKSQLSLLIWPAIIAGFLVADGERTPKWVRALIYISTGLAISQPLIPGSSAQRLVQVIGLDFFVTSFLATSMIWMALRYRAVDTAHGSGP